MRHRYNRFCFVAVLACMLTVNTAAQSIMQPCTLTTDTTALEDSCVPASATVPLPQKRTKRNFYDTRLYNMLYLGVPPMVLGFVMKGEDTHFRCLRNDYMKNYDHPYDNYTQYLPGAVMLGLKAFGVKGKSSWGRMLVSDAFSAVIMGTVVQTLKTSTRITRPDGSDKHSFPSGHTATAFMTATMLSKEYGRITPWIGIGAYSFATATGLMRIANNKHWLSDVLTGAGIGIISTETGYWLADIIFKNKGVQRYTDNDTFTMDDKPSFLGLYVSVNIPLSYYDIDEDKEFKTSSGSSVGVEGAYFATRHIGVGGRFAVSNTHIVTAEKNSGGSRTAANVAEDKTFDAVSMSVGPYFSLPLDERWNVGSKLLAGYITYPELKLTDGTRIEKNNGVCFGTGFSIAYKAGKRYGIRMFLDYNLQPSHSRNSGEWMNVLNVGTNFGVNF